MSSALSCLIACGFAIVMQNSERAVTAKTLSLGLGLQALTLQRQRKSLGTMQATATLRFEAEPSVR